MTTEVGDGTERRNGQSSSVSNAKWDSHWILAELGRFFFPGCPQPQSPWFLMFLQAPIQGREVIGLWFHINRKWLESGWALIPHRFHGPWFRIVFNYSLQKADKREFRENIEYELICYSILINFQQASKRMVKITMNISEQRPSCFELLWTGSHYLADN